MSDYTIFELKQSAIQYIYTIRDEINFEPVYQRVSDVWTKSKRQLLLDSVINGFDIPKIYFHEYDHKASECPGFAIIDGKQRLKAIFDFVSGKLALAKDIDYFRDTNVDLRGLTYKEFGEKYPKLKSKFDATVLPVVSIKTDDLDFVEDMFFRLNEASPLNAAEKRNAYPGEMAELVREVGSHLFFKEKVSFSSARFRHLDVATKFLYLTYRNRIVDTKKIHLDRFVYENQEVPDQLRERTIRVLDGLAESFENNDPLLAKTGLSPVYFLASLFSGEISDNYRLNRQSLVAFFDLIEINREKLRSDDDTVEVNFELSEFDRLTQTPNDAYSIEFKLRLLINYVFDGSIADQILFRITKASAT